MTFTYPGTLFASVEYTKPADTRPTATFASTSRFLLEGLDRVTNGDCRR
jgi:hypothetical protein